MFTTGAVAGVRRLELAAGEFRELEGRWPEPRELHACDASLPRHDPWGRAFRFVAAGRELRIGSAGADGAFGTCDDVVGGPVSAPAESSATPR